MKAFGFRLAAGAVTILLGAIMAAQGQKNSEQGAEKDWETPPNPQATAASPIPDGPLQPLGAPDDAMPIQAGVSGSEEYAVRMVQHVSDSPDSTFALPDTTAGSNDDVRGDGTRMTMGLPVLGDVGASLPAATDNASTPPSQPMGFPNDSPANTRSDGITFGDIPVDDGTPGPSASASLQDTPLGNEGATQQAQQAVQELVGQDYAPTPATPSNGLRGMPGDQRRTGMQPADSRINTPPTPEARRTVSSEGPNGAPIANELSSAPKAMLNVITLPGQESAAETSTVASQPQLRINTEPTVVMAPQQAGETTRITSIADPASSGLAGDASMGFPNPMRNPVAPMTDGQIANSGVSNPVASQFAGQSAPSQPIAEDIPMGSPGTSEGTANGLMPPTSSMQGNSMQGNVMPMDQGAPALTQMPVPPAATPAISASTPFPDQGTQFGNSGSSAYPNPPNASAAPTIPAQTYPGQGVVPTQNVMPGQSITGNQAAPIPATQLAPNQIGPTPARIASLPSPGSARIQSIGYQQPTATQPQVVVGPTMASPGQRKLDGMQQPSVLIQKRAPEEVKVGKPASFVLNVKNVGNATALNVQVLDRIPAGMTLVDATPRPDPSHQPELFWSLGDMQAGEEQTITLQLVPEQEGELGSVARVTFQAAASVRTMSTRPELHVVQEAPKQVLIGQQVEINLEVSNPGTGSATGVTLQEDVPQGFKHPAGRELDNLIGTLRPGETRRQVLRMQAIEPGVIQNTIRVKGDDGLEKTHTVAIEVISPKLQVALTGPTKRYLERPATFQLEIANSGTAPATNVEIAVQLDRGFTFVSTDYDGQYDPSRHAVFWSLPTLPKGDSGTVPLKLLPVTEGERVLKIDAKADMGIQAVAERRVAVDSRAELTFSINDSADPVEVGGETTYEIRVSNKGTKDDTNVRVQMQLPPGIELAGNGNFQQLGQGVIEFQPTNVMKANSESVFTVKARGVAAGTHIVKAIVVGDQSPTPVTKEESTTVYADQ